MKDFDKWNTVKKSIDAYEDESRLFVRDGDKAVSERRAVLGAWASRLPSEVKGLWPWVIAQEESALLELLAILVAGVINVVTSRGENPSARATSRDRLTTALALDMTR